MENTEKIGKEIKLQLKKNYNTSIGTVDNGNCKAVNIAISGWMELRIQDPNINYNRVINDLNKLLKQTIHNYLTENNIGFIKERTIIDLDIRESGIKTDRRSYMGCEIILSTNYNVSIDSKNVVEKLKGIIKHIIKNVFESNEYFKFHLRKKDIIEEVINEESIEYSNMLAEVAKICEETPRSKSANSISEALNL